MVQQFNNMPQGPQKTRSPSTPAHQTSHKKAPLKGQERELR